MLIGYGQPAGITATVNGAAVVNAAALVDGHPASIARISGGTGSANLRADWAGAAPIRIVGALGLTCAAGTTLTLTGKRSGDSGYPYALGGNAATQTVVELPDGSRAAWFVLPADNTPLVGLQLTVGAGAFDAGELVVMRGVEVAIKGDWEIERVDPSLVSRTIASGLHTVARRTYRRLKVGFTPDGLAQARAAGLANGMSWETLGVAVTGAARAIAVPRWKTLAAEIDAAELHRTAVYGRAAAGAMGHLGADYYGVAWSFEEVPPL
ncbi:hypothetical protein CSC62_14145 [Pseudoxanthomonas jiangsuensis]|uniref:hypothetical protein n=1 Tax=Pseudoxanthomonas jiangsuensis TaxID=619688 RepID=UPI001390E578|nr:hypothetical protein [Pseudoxanthomonas jiangsuensis]KAF1692771.1 hypothetical protein CSC62_14145 [Pseudoxanthomonas jiangsuensis]